MVGATPEGAKDREAAARAVREMFTSIAPRYDLLNHILSFNVDRTWWRRTARNFGAVLIRPGARLLDLCCGTGDMSFALLREAKNKGGLPLVLGADFSHAMLQRAKTKGQGTGIRWVEGDALRLPLASDSVDLVTAAFGFRNLADYDAGLSEIYRVLRHSGEVGILDFGEPKGLMGSLYRGYFRHVLPKLGTMISGVKGPYAYLPASVARFPAPEEILGRMRDIGFHYVSWTPYTFGIAGLYRGKKGKVSGDV